MITISKERAAEALSSFIWDFKIGDNVIYNLKVCFILYKTREDNPGLAELFNKPLTIILVAIIEALFFDLICRLDTATSHFPAHIVSKMGEIKTDIENKKVLFLRGSKVKVIKNYKMKEFITFFKKYELFGSANEPIYEYLLKAAAMRNRIHIQNYFRNFERDESLVFTQKRLKAIEFIFERILTVMEKLYVRPFDSGLREGWLQELLTII